MTGWKIVLALMSSSAFTGLVIELIREVRKYFERKNNTGLHKLETDIKEMREDYSRIAKDIKEIRTDLDAGRETEKVLLHDRLWQAFRLFQDAEQISVEDRANIDYLYAEYKKKNGNHKAKVMYEYIIQIPVTPEAEVEEGE